MNNLWDTDYQKLKQKLDKLEEDNNNKSKEIASQDKHIKKLVKKLELMFVTNTDEEKQPSWKKLVDDGENTGENEISKGNQDVEEFNHQQQQTSQYNQHHHQQQMQQMAPPGSMMAPNNSFQQSNQNNMRQEIKKNWK